MISVHPPRSELAFRFTGHEHFVLRYPWLPKAYAALAEDPFALHKEDDAMVALGLGKNMVRSLRFWVQVLGMTDPFHRDRGLPLRKLAGELLDPGNGFDPYLEDSRTLWLLHWMLSTADPTLLAWHTLLFDWPDPTFTRSRVAKRMLSVAEDSSRRAVRRTVTQHFDIFLHTYLVGGPKDARAKAEDYLDSPFVELQLVEMCGRTALADEPSKMEDLFRLPVIERPGLPDAVVFYAVIEFWQRRAAQEKTLSFAQVAHGEGSPGRAFRLPELDLRDRLSRLEKFSRGAVSFHESATLSQLVVRRELPQWGLAKVYHQ